MDSDRGHQLALSAKKSSHYHFTGAFTWTVAVAISWPGQHNRVAMDTKGAGHCIEDTVHGQQLARSA
jgi:hypothetical protein